MIALVLALLAAAAFFGSTLLVDSTLGTSRRFHHLSVVVAAGILLGVAFADLIPETLELVDGQRAALSIATGFLLLFLVEALTRGHTHHHEPHAHGHAHGHAHAHAHAPRSGEEDDGCVPRHAIAPFLIGLGIHNFADGIVIGTSHEVSDAASTGVAIGIMVHQVPVGLSFAAVLVASGIAARRLRSDAVLVAAMIPLGALVVLAVPTLGATSLGTLIGMSAGAVLYIASGHLLPEAQSEHRRPGVAAAFAASLLATILFIGAFHSHDDHENGESHAADTHQDEAGHDDEADDENA